MTPATFAQELKRLKSEWPNSFGEARQLALWDLYKDLPDKVFADAVTQIVLNGSTYPPRAQEFEKQIEWARLRYDQRRAQKMDADREPELDLGDTRTPELIQKVRGMVDIVSRGIGSLPGKVDADERHRELRGQLRIISGKDAAAGEKEE